MSGRGFIEAETESEICELCGRQGELRPYGPRGERVCFDCGMLDEKAAQRQFSRVVFGETIQ